MIAGAFAIWLLIAPKPWVAAAQIHGKMDTLDYVQIYGWIAGAINIVLFGVLAAVCPWWTRESTTLNAQLSTLNSQRSGPSLVLAFGGRRDGDDHFLQPAAHEPRVLG